ncbi:DUF447 domain-containing protein [Natronosalvus amylolyticus]|uniref:DUF447 domain-containing protein n=1 Tax=Natronosalvus amylolyticus TaxID=2961994 RepID=UPI0020C945A8|nr:DUF447 domain-containing protein [Natronosalvus amylolyticus]
MTERPSDSGETEVTDASWPVDLTGVTESVVTTLGPNGLWNVAVLGLFAEDPSGGCSPRNHSTLVRARTWGNTRTKRNFHRQGCGYVQFTRDPVDFVDGALSITERDDPLLESADAWVRVQATPEGTGTEGGTEWEDWTLEPLESAVRNRTVTPINRGFGAVIEATVVASRLDVEGYDRAELEGRLEHCLDVVNRAGGPREQEAFANLCRYSGWFPRR